MSESQVLPFAVIEICTQCHSQVSPLLPILHNLSRLGCLADEAAQAICARLSLPWIEVGGAVSL